MIFCALPAVSPTMTFNWAVQIVSAMKALPARANDYVIRVLRAPGEVPAAAWNELLARAGGSPFMRHEYLAALHDSGSATAATGWDPHFVTLWRGDLLQAACVLYLKDHSYG